MLRRLLMLGPALGAATALAMAPVHLAPAVAVGAGLSVSVSPNPEVESGNSDAYAVFFAHTSPVFAEGTAQIESGQLFARCHGGVRWITNRGVFSGSSARAAIDNDGNAVFTFLGDACAAGSSAAIVDVAGGGSKRVTFTILPPKPR